MRFLKRGLVVLGGSIVLLLLAVVLFLNPIFRAFLGSALADLRETQGLQVTYEEASLSLGGGVRIKGLDVVDVDSKSTLAKIPTLEVDFGWRGLLSHPRTIQAIRIEKPVLTYVSAVMSRLQSGGEGKAEPEPPGRTGGEVEEASAEGEDFLIRDFFLSGGQFRFRTGDSEEDQVVVGVEASAKDLSLDRAVQFKLSVQSQQNIQGRFDSEGRIDPKTYDCDLSLALKDLAYRPEEGVLPRTNGKAVIKIGQGLSRIAAKGSLRMEKPPASVPEEIRAGTPFEISWNVEGESAEGGGGELSLQNLEIAVSGLEGGTQEIVGGGSYDPSTAQGSFSIRSEGISMPLLNPFARPSTGMRVEAGKARIVLGATRAGENTPFEFEGNIGIVGLALREDAENGARYDFKSAGLNLSADYSPEKDLLNLRDLSVRVDEIPLALSGKVDGLLSEPDRELNLKIAGSDLDVGRIVALFAPAFAAKGSLSGKADVDLAVTGKTSSDKFPILAGILNAKGLTLVPKDSPEMKVAVTGRVQFDSENVSAESLDVRLAEVPGKVGLSIEGYNQPRKKVKATIEGVAIGPVVNLVNADAAGYLDGSLDSRIATVVGAGGQPESLEVDFEIGKGKLLEKNPIPPAVAQTLGWKWLKGNYPLTTAKGKIVKGGNGYELQNVVLAGKEGSLSVDGRFDASVKADASIRLSAPDGKTSGEIGLVASVDPKTFDGKVELSVKGLSYPTKSGPLPKTNGNLTAETGANLSKVRTTGRLAMASAPAAIPDEIRAGTPFELQWNVESDLPSGSAGKVDLKQFDITVQGLKGGSQQLAGSGSYDPTAAKGDFKVRGEQISVPLLNPFFESGAGIRVLSGKANVNLQASRAGEKSPFDAKGRIQLVGLGLKDLSGKKPNMKFDSVGLDFAVDYSPQSDLMNLRKVSASLDNILLEVSGKMAALQDSKKRELDLNVKGNDLDVGRIVPLAAPSFGETGTLSGTSDVDLHVGGRTSSDKFPVLVGSVTTKGITLAPAKSPEMKVAVRGRALFDSDDLTAESLDVKLAEVPGKLSLKVKAYNEPIKKILATIRGFDIEPLMKIYKPAASGIVIGKLNADVDTIVGQRSHPETLDVSFTIDEGVLLTRHPLPKAIVNLVQWEWMRNGIPLTNAKGHIFQDDAGYVIDSLFLMGEKGGITARGHVGFDDRLDIQTRVNVAKAAAGELNPLIQKALRARKESDWAYLAIDVKGTIQNPLPVPRFDAAIGAVVDQVRDRIGQEIDGKVGEEIRRRTGVDTDGLIEGAGSAIRGIFDRGDKEKR